MADGTRSGSNGHLTDVLDRCLAQMRQGESLERCLREHSEESDILRPLLEIGDHLMAVEAAPIPMRDLSAGRCRFLAAAAARREVLAREADGTAEALDTALAGAAATDAGAFASDGEALASLVSLAGTIRASTIAPPRPPTMLARGRERMLSAAALARDAAAEIPSEAAVALDAVLGGTRSGAPHPDAPQVAPSLTGALEPLVALARRIEAEVIEAPMSSGALEPGRARLLAAARQRRGRRTGARSRIATVLSPGRHLSTPRLAAAALLALVFVTVSGGALAPAAASALPGDSLYGLKLFGERVQFALAFDPVQRERLEIEHSRARGNEIAALLAAGRAAEIESWKVWLFQFVDLTSDDANPHGRIEVAVPRDDGAQMPMWSLLWNAGTRFDLRGRFESPHHLPPGIPMVVSVAVSPDQEPLALAVRLTSDDDPPETATPDQTVIPTSTAEPDPTATPDVSPEPTGTPGQTTTPTADGSAEPFASVTPDPILTGKPDRDRLRGVVESKSSSAMWSVRSDAANRGSELHGTLVTVDISQLPDDATLSVQVGDWVQMVGRYLDRERTVFLAAAMDRHAARSSSPSQAACSVNQAIGYVQKYTPVTSLTLTDGSEYDLTGLGAEVAPQGLQTGSRVRIVYKDCGDGRRVVTEIESLDTPAETILRGTVEEATASGFTLATRSGARYRVAVDTETVISGADRVRDGQVVMVRGWLDDRDVLHAREIRLRDAAPEPTDPAPPVTAVPPVEPPPVPTATPELAEVHPAVPSIVAHPVEMGPANP